MEGKLSTPFLRTEGILQFKRTSRIILLVALLGVIYYPVFVWMWQRWFAADSYYAHGPLIPVVTAVLIWLRRKDLPQVQLQSSKLGLAILIAGLLLHIASAFTRIYFTSAYSIFIVLLGLSLYFFGRQFTQIILFPLCFLLFMFPAPVALIEGTTLRMKLFIAQSSVYIIQLLGIPALRDGSTVYMQSTSVVVGDPCSGLRSLISLSALSILYAYIVKSSYLRKTALFISSIPIAIIANMIRTIATLLIANAYGNDIITNKYLHEGFGLMVFIIAFAGLFLVGRLLGCKIAQKDS